MGSKDLIKACLLAIENEIAIDLCTYRMLNLNPSDYSYMPRPSKWYTKYSKNRILIKPFFKVFRVLWSFFGSYLYSLFELFRLLIKWISCKKILIGSINYNEFALGFSERSYVVIPQAIKRNIECWVTFPWVESQVSSGGLNTISIMSLLELKDFFKAYAHSVQLHFKMLKEHKSHICQNYVGYKWILSFMALTKLKPAVVLTAMDSGRWALLSDVICESIILVQHGVLGGLSSQEGSNDLSYKVPNRLKNIKQIYALDGPSRQILVSEILFSSAPGDLRVSYYTPKISLTELCSSKDIKILFVGHTLCEPFQKKLYLKISKEIDALVYYKPHPLCNPSKEIRCLGWTVIEDKNCFPDVDVLISYYSTLVEEYRALGISAVVHKIDEDELGLDYTFLNLIALLNNNKSNHCTY